MQGIPKLDAYTTRIHDARDEAEVRNIGKEIGRDPALSGGQQAALMEAVRASIQRLTQPLIEEHYGKDGLTTVDVPPGKGVKSVGQALSDVVRATESIPSSSTPPDGGALSPVKVRGPLMPALAPEQIKEAWDAWHKLGTQLVDRTPVDKDGNTRDVALIKGREYLRITFWRKVRVAYRVEYYQRGKPLWSGDGPGLKVQIEMGFRAPNGDTTTSIGIAARAEPRLKESSDHDLMGRAWSRAFTRGMREIVGIGEPSAEEVEE